MKNYKKVVLGIAIIATITLIGINLYHKNPIRNFYNFISEQNYQSAVELFNGKIAGTNNEGKTIEIFDSYIDESVINWENDDSVYNDTVIALQLMESVDNSAISSKATAKLEYIYIEHDGNITYKQAIELKETSEFSKSMALLNTVEEKYSDYDATRALYDECKNAVLSLVTAPSTASEYEDAIEILDKCLVDVYEEEFKLRKTVLEKELSVIKDIADILEKAAINAVEGNYAQAFKLLENGQKKYPLAKELSNVLKQYQDVFIIETSVEAMRLCEEYEYEAAEKVVDDALTICYSDDLRNILVSIQEDKKPINKIRNIVTDKCDEFVKALENSGTIDYVSASIEKLALGDYSDEESTLLSTGATVAASLVSADLPMDIRDMAHCITNPEDHTATDYVINTLALVPVIGAVKYLDDFIPVIKTTDKVSDTVDSTTDAVKNTPIEDIKNIAESAKNKITTTANRLFKKAEYKKTDCEAYIGKFYPDTTVKVKQKKVALKDGRVIKGAFPVFDSKIDIMLPDDYLKMSRAAHNNYLNKTLKEMAENPKELKKLEKIFTAEEIERIKQGIQLEDYTWHHSEEEGLMQLVDYETHAKISHTGGYSIWGRGNG